MATYYKYAERDADSQINWAEVGKGISDMLSETNRVRQEKKDALDTAQRETMNYLAETPNGEHVGANQSILEYANKGSNQMRIMKQLMEQGQLDVKDYIIFRQNLTDNTNLAFNANKLYQEKYSDVMKGVADKKYSQLYADNFAEVEGFGNWGNIGWQIAPDGTVLAGKMIEEEVDGKKVRTLDKTPGGLRSMNYLNQAMASQIDFYNYENKVNAWADTLGKEENTTVILGRIQKQGQIKSVEDITSRKDIDPETKKVLFTFLQAENDQIASIVGNPFDASRVLVDSAIFAPNGKQYGTTTSEEEAKKNPNLILKVVDPDSGGFKYVISEGQQEDVNEFIRGQMRAQYNYQEKSQVVGAVSRDESAEAREKAAAKYRPRTDSENKQKEGENFGKQLGTAIGGDDPEDVANSIIYLAQKSERQVDRQGDKIIVSNLDGTGKSVFDLNSDPNKIVESMVGAFGTDLPEDVIIKFAKEALKGKPSNKTVVAKGLVVKDTEPEPVKINIPLGGITQSSKTAVSVLKKALGSNFIVKEVGYNPLGNDILITTKDGKEQYAFTSGKSVTAAAEIQKDLEGWAGRNSGTKELD